MIPLLTYKPTHYLYINHFIKALIVLYIKINIRPVEGRHDKIITKRRQIRGCIS